jgi:hypothetical protein
MYFSDISQYKFHEKPPSDIRVTVGDGRKDRDTDKQKTWGC